MIDRNYYLVDEARRSNMRHRTIGLGVQGLADAFMMMRLPFESETAQRLNLDIFETIYFAACEASCELAAQDGPYETFSGSPASKGQLLLELMLVFLLVLLPVSFLLVLFRFALFRYVSISVAQ